MYCGQSEGGSILKGHRNQLEGPLSGQILNNLIKKIMGYNPLKKNKHRESIHNRIPIKCRRMMEMKKKSPLGKQHCTSCWR